MMAARLQIILTKRASTSSPTWLRCWASAATISSSARKGSCPLNTAGTERTKNLGTTSPYFIEVFVPQGSTGHVCAWALKDGKVLAFGTTPRNPLKMQGMGEVMFTDLELPLQPVSPPVKAPAGL